MDSAEAENLIIQSGIVTREQLDECVMLQREYSARGRTPPSLTELLTKKGYASSEKIDELLGGGQEVSSSSDSRRVRAGERFGKFRIEERFGEDATGTTYRAIHTPSKTEVTLHILSRRALDQKPNLKKRFDVQLKTAYELRHPGIQRLVSAGRIDDQHYYAAQFLMGTSLRRFILDGKVMDWREALRITVEIAKALSCGHHAGLCHGEIKPSNVLLLEDGSVILLSYGVPRDSVADFDAIVREFGESPCYQPPEMLKGGDDSPAADFYSLGMMLYHLLTGEAAVSGQGSAEALVAAMNKIPCDPRRLAPQIPDGLACAIIRMTAVNPDFRYTGADELLSDLLRESDDEKLNKGFINWPCPSKGCFAPLTVKADRRGRAAVCPLCGEGIEVPFALPDPVSGNYEDRQLVTSTSARLCETCGTPVDEYCGDCRESAIVAQVVLSEDGALSYLHNPERDRVALLAADTDGVSIAACDFYRKGDAIMLPFVDGEGRLLFEAGFTIVGLSPLVAERRVMRYRLAPVLEVAWKKRWRTLGAVYEGSLLPGFRHAGGSGV